MSRMYLLFRFMRLFKPDVLIGEKTSFFAHRMVVTSDGEA